MHDHARPSALASLEGGITRRQMLLASGGALAVIVLAGCGGSSDTSAAPVAGSFVGPVAGTDATSFAAVVAAAPLQEGDPREVRAYLCSAEVQPGGQTYNEWFTGSTVGDDLDLVSDGGARLVGSVASGEATGTFTLKDGVTLPLGAGVATGVAGLYNVNLLPGGVLTGTSETGGRLEGQLGPPKDGFYPASVTLTAPDGQERAVENFFDTDEPGEFRWIVLADGTAKGARKGVVTGAGKGAGFSWPHID